ncbi:MAG: TetR/AcrR family transcriptional regulator [Microthrixaceae bacterium]
MTSVMDSSTPAPGPSAARGTRRSGRDAMIDAAERLVAEQGLAAMSLREVQVLAGQRNKSAAQYHFGTRDGLIEAVLLTRMAPVNDRRHELLDAAVAQSPTPTTRQLVEALVRPVAEHTILSPRPSHWARFLLQCSSDPTLSEVVRRSVEGQAYRQLHQLLLESLDHVPPPLRSRRVDHAVGLLFMSLAATEERRRSLTTLDVPVETQVEDLIDTCVGLLAAPPSPHTLATLTASPDRPLPEES